MTIDFAPLLELQVVWGVLVPLVMRKDWIIHTASARRKKSEHVPSSHSAPAVPQSLM